MNIDTDSLNKILDGITNYVTIHVTESRKLALWPTKMHNGKWIIFENYKVVTEIHSNKLGMMFSQQKKVIDAKRMKGE